jgi:hypothetical protein
MNAAISRDRRIALAKLQTALMAARHFATGAPTRGDPVMRARQQPVVESIACRAALDGENTNQT